MTEEHGPVPPHDVAAEQSALGGMLMNTDARIEVAGIIGAGDFYQPRHGIVFDAILALDTASEAIDAVTVAAHLMDHGDLDRIGGATYLHDLLNAVPTAANAAYYARIVADRALQRRLILAATEIARAGYNPAGRDVPDIVEVAQKLIHEATTGRMERSGTTWDALADGVMAAIDSGKRQRGGIPTGLAECNALTGGGFKPGELVIVAARPGMGKSVFLIDVCRQAAFREGKSVALFSLEMSEEEIATRITAAESRVSLDALGSDELTDDETKHVTDALSRLAGSRLVVDDDATVTLTQIRSRARRLQQQQGLDLIAVDYLQLMTAARRSQSRVDEVGEISRGLKLLAKELRVPVVVAAQLNRGPEQRTGKVPHLSDLRESGSIENDADVVLLIHRPSYYDKTSPRKAEADFIVAKNRHGATDTFTAIAQLHYARFVDYHPEGTC